MYDVRCSKFDFRPLTKKDADRITPSNKSVTEGTQEEAGERIVPRRVQDVLEIAP